MTLKHYDRLTHRLPEKGDFVLVKFVVQVNDCYVTLFEIDKIYTLYIFGEGSKEFGCFDYYCIETNAVDFLGKDWFYDEDIKYEIL